MKFPDTEREARDSQILSASLLKAMDVAVIATNLQGEIIYWNRYAEYLYGWTTHEVIGRNILDITVAPENADQAIEIMAELSRGRSWTGEFRLLRKDGSIFTGVVTDSPVFDDNGNHVAIVGVSHPLTETRLGFEKQAQEHAASLRLLSQRLLHAQDEERRKIARDLHDSVGQLMSLIKMSLVTIADSNGRVKPAVVEEIRTLANTAITEIRTMSYLLHPPFLDEMGLATAAQWLVEGFGERSGIKVVCDVPDQMPRLSPNLETSAVSNPARVLDQRPSPFAEFVRQGTD